MAGFTSAIVLAMIALLIGYESVSRLFAPVPIHFGEAIPIAGLGLAVNIASAWLLSGGHHHGHSHGQEHPGHAHSEGHRIPTAGGAVILNVFEAGAPPRFRLRAESGAAPAALSAEVETVRPNGARQLFQFIDRGEYLESVNEIPEPHAFAAHVRIGGESHATHFEEHEHTDGTALRDNNMRAAVIHVLADAAVSVLVIVGLLLARAFGWLWMDPLAGIVGAGVIASWSYGLIRDTGAILLDVNPDKRLAERLRQVVESEGDQLTDLHLWRLGPGHLGAIVSIITKRARGPAYYRARLSAFQSLSHLTIQVDQPS